MFYDIAVNDLALYYKIKRTNNYTCILVKCNIKKKKTFHENNFAEISLYL